MEVSKGANEEESGVVPQYLTISKGFAGLSHSCRLLEAAMDSMAVLPVQKKVLETA